jgi:hypothetical protein
MDVYIPLWSWIVNVVQKHPKLCWRKKKKGAADQFQAAQGLEFVLCVVGALLNLQYCIKVLAGGLFDNPQKRPHFVKFFLFSHVYERDLFFFFFLFLADEKWRKTKVCHPGASALT